MSMEKIEQLTKDYAKTRTDVVSLAAVWQAQLDDINGQYEALLAPVLRQLDERMAALNAAIEANRDLFPEGAKSVVIEGIKVGYQGQKAGVSLGDKSEDEVIDSIVAALNNPANDMNAELVRQLQPCVLSVLKLVKPEINKLPRSALEQIGLQYLPASDAVLIKPVEDDAFKAVQNLIKRAQAAAIDAPAA